MTRPQTVQDELKSALAQSPYALPEPVGETMAARIAAWIWAARRAVTYASGVNPRDWAEWSEPIPPLKWDRAKMEKVHFVTLAYKRFLRDECA